MNPTGHTENAARDGHGRGRFDGWIAALEGRPGCFGLDRFSNSLCGAVIKFPFGPQRINRAKNHPDRLLESFLATTRETYPNEPVVL